ncbi:MAG: hypothetical protein N2652_04515 [Kiritimatiellae bacterium]|nr:hypothetical protein [Kiritimatiellia bacterium]
MPSYPTWSEPRQPPCAILSEVPARVAAIERDGRLAVSFDEQPLNFEPDYRHVVVRVLDVRMTAGKGTRGNRLAAATTSGCRLGVPRASHAASRFVPVHFAQLTARVA